jgi:hypothetical protein
MKNSYYKSEKRFNDIDQQEEDLRPMSHNFQQPTSLVATYDATSKAKYAVNTDLIGYIPPKDATLTIHDKMLQKHQSKRVDWPQDFLFWSIANVFIFVILALPALFFSVQVREMKRANNYEKAKYYSKRCLILNIIASVLGLLAITLAIIFRFALYHLFVQNDVQSQSVPLNGSAG